MKKRIVGLGSHCEVAGNLRFNDARVQAYPFDWLLTTDHAKFELLLERDFVDFLNPDHLHHHLPAGNVVNTLYNIDFRHDHTLENPEFLPDFTGPVLEKYERRIQRFRELEAEGLGTVYFVRVAWDTDMDSGVLPTITPGCDVICVQHAIRLRDILRARFPSMDVQVVCVNYAGKDNPGLLEVEGVHQYIIRKTHKQEDYTAMVTSLLQ
jgi:hypothetical protein